MRRREQTVITQVHAYLKEHYRPGDLVTVRDIRARLPYLRQSAISAALWELGKERILLCEPGTGPHGGNTYMVTDAYLTTRGTEDLRAPEPGLPRKRKPTKRST